MSQHAMQPANANTERWTKQNACRQHYTVANMAVLHTKTAVAIVAIKAIAGAGGVGCSLKKSCGWVWVGAVYCGLTAWLICSCILCSPSASARIVWQQQQQKQQQQQQKQQQQQLNKQPT
jgi:hypothetical protein